MNMYRRIVKLHAYVTLYCIHLAVCPNARVGLHKLSPMWEGPYRVVHIARPGSARLEERASDQRD